MRTFPQGHDLEDCIVDAGHHGVDDACSGQPPRSDQEILTSAAVGRSFTAMTRPQVRRVIAAYRAGYTGT